ncbi:MAG: CDP-alcohol phosphatidyltransferase family protein [Alphaproteobacteria bacterium]
MFDTALRRLIDPTLDRVGAMLARRGVPADAVTLSGLIAGLGAALAVACGLFLLAFALMVINRALDGLDGAIARSAGRTDAGGFLDIMCDFIFYGSLPIGFAIAVPAENALPAAVLLLSFYINGSAFLAFATLVAKSPHHEHAPANKAFHYLWGLAEGTETIVVFSAMTLVPTSFPVLAWGFAAVCLISGVLRIVHGYRVARVASQSQPSNDGKM